MAKQMKMNKKNMGKMTAEQKREYQKKLDYTRAYTKARAEWQTKIKSGELAKGVTLQEYRDCQDAGKPITNPQYQGKKKNELEKAVLKIVEQPIHGLGIATLGEKLLSLGKRLIELDGIEKAHLKEVSDALHATGLSLGSVRKSA